jgi:prevent-host-death family protein
MLSIQSNKVKTHFSGVLRQVEQGQEFLITRHKKVVAKLMPYSSDITTNAESKKAVEAMKQINCLNLSLSEINDYRSTGRR